MGDQTGWLLAQGEVDGRPIYVRARDPSQTAISETRKFLVVATLIYGLDDPRQLPSDDDYAQLEAFEAKIFDTPGSDPELVAVETGSGGIRYFAYTSDTDQTLAAIIGAAPFEIAEWDVAEDPDWEVYHMRVANLQGG